jgi:hypothetical protein
MSGEAMTDKLDFDAINALSMPFWARFCGGDIWPVYDIDVETGLMRIDVCGLLQVMHFADVIEIRDADGRAHDSDDFWLDKPVA